MYGNQFLKSQTITYDIRTYFSKIHNACSNYSPIKFDIPEGNWNQMEWEHKKEEDILNRLKWIWFGQPAQNEMVQWNYFFILRIKYNNVQ